MANYGFIIDNRRCIGCHACTVACKSEHQVSIGVNRTWVKYIEKGVFPHSRRLFSVLRCNHCDDAPCVEICPVTALFRRSDGIVDFDNRRCIGCKACMQACPYDALYIDPQTQTAAKCNYCAHRIDVGLEPACVVVCPTQAIVSGDLDDPNSRISQIKNRHQVTARRVEKGTQPQLFYIDGDIDSLDPLAAPPQSGTLWGQQVRGVGQHAPDESNGHLHPLDLLSQWLAVPDEDPRRQADKERLVHDVLADRAPRRAYDAPKKGTKWGWQVPSYLFTKGIAAGAMFVPLLAVSWGLNLGTGLLNWSVLAALVFLVFTGLLLIADLKQPKRFLYVLLRPQWRSWLVRGAYCITCFGALIPVYWLAATLGGLHWAEAPARWL
ncbi:MAG TPA: 4Fe-4S dicluster domain-containing protein, partial [Pirellulaceae bacterium]|nr:4Fe-4S dicluster domain-containing protein [Pirellulaceae bacterium]